ncbi:MAG: 2OG-Fe(II) oxygenase [Pseudonocardiaceae bacterium]
MTATAEEPLLDSLRCADWQTEPWRYACIPAALPFLMAEKIAAEFPAELLKRCSRLDGEKSYRFRTAPVDAATRRVVGATALPELIETLASECYRTLLGTLTGTDLDDARLTTSLWEYASGDWLVPHVDKVDKIVTQIFYLTPGWKEHDGGRLLILGSSDQRDVRAAHVPVLGSSAVLVRSDASWHAVEAPLLDIPARRSLTATFWY